ncbi:DnaJ protein, putative [Plasmodium sp. gorilla clade G2]|uniref:DnaJ protein, putative n=1 Tax=Plasmodium sp. gorilla clade G2 TaxID=880535 RepID=UPI000D2170C0|nr:DnaJ protein, putative [Plasmodium sp. gorilla clade G2]SOV15738.1 DnaJ protein, putative [Plasmodium sp. gorilla clade G2]
MDFRNNKNNNDSNNVIIINDEINSDISLESCEEEVDNYDQYCDNFLKHKSANTNINVNHNYNDNLKNKNNNIIIDLTLSDNSNKDFVEHENVKKNSVDNLREGNNPSNISVSNKEFINCYNNDKVKNIKDNEKQIEQNNAENEGSQKKNYIHINNTSFMNISCNEKNKNEIINEFKINTNDNINNNTHFVHTIEEDTLHSNKDINFNYNKNNCINFLYNKRNYEQMMENNIRTDKNKKHIIIENAKTTNITSPCINLEDINEHEHLNQTPQKIKKKNYYYNNSHNNVIDLDKENEETKNYCFYKNDHSSSNKNRKKNSPNHTNPLKNNMFRNILFNKKFKIEDLYYIKLKYDDLTNIEKKEEENVKNFYNKYYKCSFYVDKNIENICLKKYDICNYCKNCLKFLKFLIIHGNKYKGNLINIFFIYSDIQQLIFTYKCEKKHLFNISLFHVIHNLWCPHDFCLFQCKGSYNKNYATEFFRLKELDSMEKQKRLFLQAKVFCLFNSYGTLPVNNKNVESECTNDIDRIIKNANNPWEVLQMNMYTKLDISDKTELKKMARKNYHKLALKVHPDKNKNDNASLAMNILTNSMQSIMSI